MRDQSCFHSFELYMYRDAHEQQTIHQFSRKINLIIIRAEKIDRSVLTLTGISLSLLLLNYKVEYCCQIVYEFTGISKLIT